VPIGQLKQMAADGKLTSDAMANAFKNPALVNSLREQAKQVQYEYQVNTKTLKTDQRLLLVNLIKQLACQRLLLAVLN
jgi:long-subunit fatty acid transport protein